MEDGVGLYRLIVFDVLLVVGFEMYGVVVVGDVYDVVGELLVGDFVFDCCI